MRTLLVADLHLNNNPRDEYRHAFQTELRKIVRREKPEVVVINGDLTDEKDYHPAVLVNRVVQHIYELANITPNVIINKGNHDYTALASTPFFEFLSRLERVEWVNKPKEFYGFLMLPHTPNHERDWKNLNWGFAQHVVAHNTFAGTKSDRGFKLDGIPTGIFPKGVKVWSGDVHTPQEVGPVTYIGAPYTVDFGDDYEPRVILLDNGKPKFIPCPGPQKRLLEVKLGHKLPASFPKFNRGDILKVRAIVNSDQYARWSEFVDGVHQWGIKHGFVVHMVQPVHDKAPVKRTVPQAVNRKSDEQIVKDFAKRQSMSSVTLKTGLKFL